MTISEHTADTAERFVTALSRSLPLLVLTGAGVSAGAGIPTYRDAQGRWLRSDPITHQEFVQNPRQRQRYWGRSLIGWPAVRDARPAPAHRYLAQLERFGALTRVVTQNVDRLHQRAGSARVTDLHGRLDRVVCRDCAAVSCRERLQHRLLPLNPGIESYRVAARPDGDADLPEDLVDSVCVAPCETCGGVLMPDVVFFGGNIPAPRLGVARVALERARGLLVVGSSLQVYSGYRFCRWAAERKIPIFIMNPGTTRADALAEKWPVNADEGLEALVARMPAAASGPAPTFAVNEDA